MPFVIAKTQQLRAPGHLLLVLMSYLWSCSCALALLQVDVAVVSVVWW
jgi:hypothetical protein